jgi:hypothetical protein
VILSVRVIPRSPTSAITGRRGDALLVRLNAPPVDGAANEALIELLAKVFGRPRRDVGHGSTRLNTAWCGHGSTRSPWSLAKGPATNGSPSRLSDDDVVARLSDILRTRASP